MNSVDVVYITLLAASIFFLVVIAALQIRIKRVSDSTHIIVNSQRTMMLQQIALLTRTIADFRPKDEKAQDAAKLAEQNAASAMDHRRVLI